MLCFVGQRARAEEVTQALNDGGFRAVAIHGDMDQVGCRQTTSQLLYFWLLLCQCLSSLIQQHTMAEPCTVLGCMPRHAVRTVAAPHRCLHVCCLHHCRISPTDSLMLCHAVVPCPALPIKLLSCAVLAQFTRMKVLESFRSGQQHLLVATDVAARGLDIKSIKTVINYDAARDIDTHIHRCGRVGSRPGAPSPVPVPVAASRKHHRVKKFLTLISHP